MQIPKTFLLSAILLMLACKTVAQTLVLHHPGGTTTDVELFTQPRVLFQEDKVVISSTVLNMEFLKSDVIRFTYKGCTSTTDVKMQKENVAFKQHGNQLVFHGIKSQSDVAVYNANGVRVPVSITRYDDNVYLSLTNMPSGVYLLNVNGKTSKFTMP